MGDRGVCEITIFNTVNSLSQQGNHVTTVSAHFTLPTKICPASVESTKCTLFRSLRLESVTLLSIEVRWNIKYTRMCSLYVLKGRFLTRFRLLLTVLFAFFFFFPFSFFRCWKFGGVFLNWCKIIHNVWFVLVWPYLRLTRRKHPRTNSLQLSYKQTQKQVVTRRWPTESLCSWSVNQPTFPPEAFVFNVSKRYELAHLTVKPLAQRVNHDDARQTAGWLPYLITRLLSPINPLLVKLLFTVTPIIYLVSVNVDQRVGGINQSIGSTFSFSNCVRRWRMDEACQAVALL